MLAEIGPAPKPLGAVRAAVAAFRRAGVRPAGPLGRFRALVLLGAPLVPPTPRLVPAAMGSQVGRAAEGLAALVATVFDPGDAGTAVLGQGKRAWVGLLAQLADKGP